MNFTLKIKKGQLDTIDLSDLWKYADWHEFFRYFNLASGNEHYRLLSHLSWQFPANTLLIDIGTSCGYSALALAHNPDVKVISYNIQDDIKDQVCSAKNKSNIELRIKNCMEDIDLLLQAPLIMLDTAHNGDFETDLITLLTEKGYKGIVICDDIYLNDQMKSFWKWVPLKQLDITDCGHWSGTGAIIFNDSHVNIEVINNF